MAAQKDARQNYHLQFVSAPTADTHGTMAVLHFDNKRYMFGRMAEGTQRACVQRGVGVKKVRNIFLTGTNTWKDNGGLIGFMLTLADQQLQEVEANGFSRPRLNIHGAPKLLHSVACARRFVFRTGVPLVIHESTGNRFQWPADPSFVDENIRVWPIAIPAGASALTGDTKSNDLAGQVQSDQAARQKIVSDMFDSEWRRDRLVETPFRSVNMPATIWIRNPETKDLQSFYCTNMDDAPEIKPDQNVLVRNPWPASLVGHLPDASNLPAGVAMSYIVRGHQQRGTFDGKMAKDLGVPNGPVRKELTNGDSITLDDGRIITPEMVLGPGKEGKGIAFFDLPTLPHLRNLQTLIEGNGGMLDNVALAAWTLGQGVATSEEFRHLILSLSTMDHLSSDPETAANILAFESVAASSTRLSNVSTTLFPLLEYNNHAPYNDVDHVRPEVPMTPVKAGLKVNIEPKYGRDESEVPVPLTISTVEKATSPSYLAAKEALGIDRISSSTSINEPEIITLGTGSALPSKYRNVSATLLRMPNGQGNYLFDCGENTMGQLRRMYTYPELQDILINLKAIWISHLHADHHLGTVTVLQERAAAFDKDAPKADRTIYLMSEQNKIDFIRDYSSVEPSLLQTTGLVPIVCVGGVGPTLDGEVFDFPAHGSPIAKAETVRVSHCWGAQAISITFQSGFKISYSGDCRPSGSFCYIGHDSDVLIHEATFDDDKDGDARAKKHSTTSEALGVALRMRAKNVILTHFSQRYQKVPNLENIKLPNEIHYEEGNETGEVGPVDEGDVDGAAADKVEPSRETMTSDTKTMDKQSAMSLGDFLDHSQTTLDTKLPPSNKDTALLASLSARREASRHRRQASAARNMAVCVAFDYMRVRVSQIKECKRLYPAIQAMFEEMEQKSEERRAAEREKNEAQHNAKRHKKDKWQGEQESGKKKLKANETKGKRNGRIDTAALKGGEQSQDLAGQRETSSAAENWWNGLTEPPSPSGETQQSEHPPASTSELNETIKASAATETPLVEKSKKQLKREAARDRKQSAKKAKLRSAEGNDTTRPPPDDEQMSSTP